MEMGKKLELKLEVFELNPQFVQYSVCNSANEVIGLLTLEAPYNLNEAKKEKIHLL